MCETLSKPQKWPPWCCVPAFVFRALEERGYHNLSRPAIARELKVKVPQGTSNPWNLNTAIDELECGVQPRYANEDINRLLRSFDDDLGFRYIPLSTVTLGLHAEVATQAIQRHCTVAVGFNYKALRGARPEIMRHVARIAVQPDRGEVSIIDDFSDDPPPVHTLDWPRLEAAIHQVKDGFWIIGQRSDLSLQYTLPFSG